MDTLFVQFWTPSSFHNILFLHNGFSSVYDECKNNGDFYWVNLRTPIHEQGLPINEGIVYISSFYSRSMFFAMSWSYRYPNIKFVVGGPSVMIDPGLKRYFIDRPLGNNIIFVPELAEEAIFKKQSRNDSWGIELPTVKCDSYVVSFTNETGCYWNKCTFCNYDLRGPFYNSLKNLELDPNKKWIIWFATAALSPRYMINEFHRLKPNIEYHFNIRADISVLNVLEKVLSKCKDVDLVFHIGVECPVNRILKYMKKGTDIETMIKVMEIIKKYGQRFRINLILGWDILTKADLEEIKKFSEYVRSLSNTKIRANVYWLECTMKRQWQRHGNVRLVLNEAGPYRMEGIFVDPSKDQQELNFATKSIYEENFNIKIGESLRKYERYYYNEKS